MKHLYTTINLCIIGLYAALLHPDVVLSVMHRTCVLRALKEYAVHAVRHDGDQEDLAVLRTLTRGTAVCSILRRCSIQCTTLPI
jgi:hypothetical protein